ncbi:MAG: T9SS type A sorting domain-containing protein [Bacteroidia bacterium]
MKHLLFSFILTSVCLLFITPTKATHVTGSEIGWTHLGNNEYAITVTVYRDCNGVNVSRTPIIVESNCGKEDKIGVPKYISDITPVCSEQCTRCQSSGCTFKYGIEKFELTAVFDLSQYIKNGCCEFTISWGDCCRSGNITTGAANQGMYIEAFLNSCISTNVSWNKAKAPIACLGRDLSLNHSITTENSSDSIVYALTSGLTGASTSITYSSSYDADKFINYLGFPKTGLKQPRGLHFNSATGILFFRPMKVEISVAAFEAQVYRNGKLIAKTMRDMQFVIIKCPDNNPPVLSGFDGEFDPAAFSKVVCIGNTSKFLFKTNDKEIKDTVIVEFGNGIGDSLVTINNDAKGSAYWYWTPDTSDITTQFQNFSLTAIDNACPVNARTQQVYRIKVVEPTAIDPKVNISALDSCGHYLFQIHDKNNQPISAKWYLNNDTFEGDSISFKITKSGRQIVKAVVEGCSSIELIDTFFVNNVYKLKTNLNDTTFCATKVVLAPNIKGANGKLNYNWTISDGLNYNGLTDESSLLLNLNNLSGLIDQHISLKLEDSLGCKLEKSVAIKIKSSVAKQLASGGEYCENTSKQIALNTYNGNGNWYGNGVENNIINIEKLQPGKHNIRFIFESANNCIVDTAKFTIYESPNIKIDNELTTCVGAEEIGLTAEPQGGNWSGDGISGTTFNPNNAGKGNHNLIYWVTNAYNCANQDTLLATVYDYIPNVNITDIVTACEYADEIELTSTIEGGTWSGNGVLSTANPLSLSPALLNIGPNSIAYEYTDSNECSFYDTSYVIVNEQPTASFTLSKRYFPKGDSIKANNTTLNASAHSFLWLIGDPVFIGENTTNLKTVVDTIGIFDVTLFATNTTTGCIDTFIINDAIEVGPVGIKDVDLLKSLYPNPASTFINLPFEKEQVINYSIFSINGKSYGLGQVTDARLNVADLPNGIYILRLNDGAKTAHYLFNKN